MQLSVNLNKIALLRNARNGARPNLLLAAKAAIAAGAYGITVHPRPDLRHIRPDDVTKLASMLRRDHPGIEFNIEGNPAAGANNQGYPGLLELIEQTRPDQATLVPDSDAQLTSDHGFPLASMSAANRETLAGQIRRCHAAGARVSLFMDPNSDDINCVPATGAERIELYTGPFAAACAKCLNLATADNAAKAQAEASLEDYRQAAQHAHTLGLGVNAGHDLDLHNLPLFRTITEVVEVSIGHALVADALDMGFESAVRAYVEALQPIVRR